VYEDLSQGLLEIVQKFFFF